ncbi:MAG TPA: TonB-dependent receptor [Chryseolinea sp.]|nr:TonB-dependent receptor [Chryseolinea sp.]
MIAPKSLKLWLLAPLLIFPGSVFAQNGSVSGTIKDLDGRGILSAVVQLKGTKYGAVSDTSGFYILKDIRPGTYTLSITHLNYERDSLNIEVTKSLSLQISRQLLDKVSALDEIEIYGKTESQEVREKPFEVSVIDVQPLQQKNIDLNRILTQSSGVRVRQNAGLGSSFDLTLNGFKASQFINGIPIDAFGSAYSFNSIPVNQIDRIEIYKGVVPVHLGGDALGGAVNIVTKNNFNNNLNLSYSVGSFNTHKASLRGVFTDKSSGLTVLGSAFFNYSDNSYTMKDMEIISGTTTYKKDVKRFHDDFLSYAVRAEAGYANKKFADAFFIGAGFSGIRKDIQTGSTQYPPIGEAVGEENNNQISVRYRKHGLLNGKLDLDGFVLLSNTNTLFADTSSKTFQWDGTVLIQRPENSQSGEFEEKQIYKTRQQDLTQRYNISYHLTNSQTLKLNVISSNTQWNNTDPGKVEGTSVEDNSSNYSKIIVGLGHELKLWNEKFQSTAFVKYYRMNASVDSAARWRGGYFDRAPLESNKSFTGAGLGVSYAFTEKFMAKVSAEYACRLPSVYELLGDGITTVANVSLQPELSMNYNVGFLLKLVERTITTLTLGGSGFYRQAENFIRATTGVRRSTFINFDAALVRGVESEARLIVAKKLGLRLNATYQQVLDDNKYVGGTIKNYSYHVQLPNTPSLFANADIEYRITGLANDRITLVPYYNILYVREFYLGYENIARGDLKYTIPMQLVQDIGLTISDVNDKYSVSIDCSNITDALAYDNFRLQKPGRAFNIKFTYNIN